MVVSYFQLLYLSSKWKFNYRFYSNEDIENIEALS